MAGMGRSGMWQGWGGVECDRDGEEWNVTGMGRSGMERSEMWQGWGGVEYDGDFEALL